MNKTSETKPNVLLTETCNRSCRYCFAKDEMAGSKKKEMDFSDFEKVLDFLEHNGQKEVRLMGGEPTLHSRFRDIIDLAIARGFQVNLFTNGFFPRDLAEFLEEGGGLVEYSFNLTAITSDGSQKKEIAKKNLEELSKASKVYGSVTIDDPDFDAKEVIELVRKNKISLVRLGIANNMVKNTGRGISDDYKKITERIFMIAKDLKEKAGVSKVTLSCGLTPCMFGEGVSKDNFLPEGVELRGWGCAGKASHFDITAELKILPCFYADAIKEEKLTDFSSLESMGKFSKDILRHLTGDLSVETTEKCRKCAHFKAMRCGGPCLGYIANNPDDKKELDCLKRSFLFGIIRKMIFFRAR